MIDIRTLTQLAPPDLLRVAAGYSSFIRYDITYLEDKDGVLIAGRRVTLDQPYTKQWEFDDDELTRYRSLLDEGYSFGAYDGDRLLGVIITEPRQWNGSLWVWEFHVEPAQQGQGIGRNLMDTLAAKGTAEGYRIIVAEAQNTNGVGIDTYRALGFHIEGIDLSYYSNEDYADGEVAVFLKRRVGPASR